MEALDDSGILRLEKHWMSTLQQNMATLKSSLGETETRDDVAVRQWEDRATPSWCSGQRVCGKSTSAICRRTAATEWSRCRSSRIQQEKMVLKEVQSSMMEAGSTDGGHYEGAQWSVPDTQ